MVSWWGTDSYLNNEQIRISDVELMNALYGSLGSFRSRVRSEYIWNNTYSAVCQLIPLGVMCILMGHLDQELGQNIFEITHIQVEEVISVQNQLKYMYQFINTILIIHTWGVTSVV